MFVEGCEGGRSSQTSDIYCCYIGLTLSDVESELTNKGVKYKTVANICTKQKAFDKYIVTNLKEDNGTVVIYYGNFLTRVKE
ncbi:MAG: hypothetical protein PHX51_00785 [Clostridia bacterium]|nr:hypothetical protein [Clostridia bacterium]